MTCLFVCCSVTVSVGSNVAGQGDVFNGVEFINHPNYTDLVGINAAYHFYSVYNDVALIKLDRPIDLDYEDTMPICLSDHLQETSFRQCYTVGWGLHLPERGTCVCVLKFFPEKVRSRSCSTAQCTSTCTCKIIYI